MKPTEAELFHSLGDGGAEAGGGGGWGGGWKTPVFVQKYGHMTQVLSYSGKQRAVKRMKMRFLHGGRCDVRLAFIYKPSYCRGGGGGEGEGGTGVFLLLYVKRKGGGIGYSWNLGLFRILRVHICQLSSSKV